MYCFLMASLLYTTTVYLKWGVKKKRYLGIYHETKYSTINITYLKVSFYTNMFAVLLPLNLALDHWFSHTKKNKTNRKKQNQSQVND